MYSSSNIDQLVLLHILLLVLRDRVHNGDRQTAASKHLEARTSKSECVSQHLKPVHASSRSSRTKGLDLSEHCSSASSQRE